MEGPRNGRDDREGSGEYESLCTVVEPEPRCVETEPSDALLTPQPRELIYGRKKVKYVSRLCQPNENDSPMD